MGKGLISFRGNCLFRGSAFMGLCLAFSVKPFEFKDIRKKDMTKRKWFR
jgi:hypothetical protein